MKTSCIRVTRTLCIILMTFSITHADPSMTDTVTRYYSLSPADFGIEAEWRTFEKYHTHLLSNNEDNTFLAPIHLPDSAWVIEFKVWVCDSEPTTDMWASLRRTLLAWGESEVMAYVQSTGSNGNQVLTDNTIEQNLVDNTNYKYSVDVHTYAPNSDHTLFGMRIKYKIMTELISVSDSETHSSPSHQYNAESYPTPFSEITSITYSVSTKGLVIIEVYDEAGRLIRTLVDEVMPAGSYIARWDGRDSEGRSVPNGSYFCVIKTNGSSTTKVVHIE